MSNLSSVPVGVILVRRLHLYIGLFIGPFLLLAALTGIAYALTPQLESYLYASALRTEPRLGPRTEPGAQPLPLAEQVLLARQSLAEGAEITALRPSPGPGDTTRIVLRMTNPAPVQQRAVFIDPLSGRVTGDLTVYGNQGMLPLRAWLHSLHRHLLMGEVGRLYSELAASWLWVAALGGVYLGYKRAPRHRPLILHEHVCLGLILSACLVFFSLTGLGATRYAGEHLATLSRYLGGALPAPDSSRAPARQVPAAAAVNRIDPATYQTVLEVARKAGVDAAELEIRPPARAGDVWRVVETQSRWPTQADAVDIDPSSLAIVDYRSFSQQPLTAKMLRWSVDAHTGVLFGLGNQVLLLVVGAGIVFMVCLGYVLCWQRRLTRSPQPTLIDAWHACTSMQQGKLVLVLLLSGLALPLLGVSLLLFVVCERLKTPVLAAQWSKG